MDYESTPLQQLISDGLVIQTEFSKAKKRVLVPTCYSRGLQAKENLQKRREKAEKLREMEELKEVTGSPKLCQKSLKLTERREKQPFGSYAMKWQEERDQKLTLSRMEESLRDVSSSLRRPVPAPPGYKNPSKDWKERALHYESTRSITPEPISHKPILDSNSRKLMSSRNQEPAEIRFNRLEEDRQRRIAEARQRSDESMESSLNFTPKTNEFDGRRPENVAEYLYSVGIEEMRKKRDMIETCVPEGCTFKPEVNRNSAELAEKRRGKTPPPKNTVFEAPLPAGKSELSQEEFSQFLTRNYTKALLKTQKSHSPQPDDPDCTFHPSINTSTVSSIDHPHRSVYDRSMTMLQSVQTKTCVNRLLLAKEELSHCTFQPKVLHRSITPPPRSPNPPVFDSSKTDERISRKSTYSTIDSDGKKTSVPYINGKKTVFDLNIRCYEGTPKLIEEMDEIQMELQALGIDW